MVLQRPTQKNRTFNVSNKKMIKPQVNFSDRIDNSHLPFVPKIRVKPNAIKPLPSIDENQSKKGIFKSIIFRYFHSIGHNQNR